MAPQLTLEFLNAAHGDAILVHWSEPPHLVVIDGGPSSTYETTLGPRLKELRSQRCTGDDPLIIDLLCATHIDDDHIGGVVRLLTGLRRDQRDGLPLPQKIQRMWHNSFEELVSAVPAGISAADVEAQLQALAPIDKAIAASVNQGRDVRDLGRALHLDGNPPFGSPVTAGRSTTLHGLSITIVAPDSGALDRLEKTWRAAKQRADPAVLAAAFTDRSVPNLSSISMLLSMGSRRALLTADARGDRILKGLEAVGLLEPNGTLHLDVLQVPHHGSANNVTQEFFERVQADHYVISADGIKHPHPGSDTLDWLIGARGGDGYTIHLTNPIPPALSRLHDLQAGRNFSVAARTDPERAAKVSLESTNGDSPR